MASGPLPVALLAEGEGAPVGDGAGVAVGVGMGTVADAAVVGVGESIVTCDAPLPEQAVTSTMTSRYPPRTDLDQGRPIAEPPFIGWRIVCPAPRGP